MSPPGDTDLDRLELELRSVPGVVAVAFDRVDDDRLFVQVVAMSGSDELAHHVRRIVGSDVRELVSLEIVDASLETTGVDLRPDAG